MKKFIVTILASSYLITTAGATIHFHYCMDKLVSWSLSNGTDGDKCENCGMKKDDNCCKDQKKVVKNTIDQKTTEASNLNLLVVTVVTPSVFINEIEYYSSLSHGSNITHSPPIKSIEEIYLRNCVFRI